MRSLVSRNDRGHRVHRWARGPACFHARRCAVRFDRYLRSYGTLPRPFSLETGSSSEFLWCNHRSRLSTKAIPARVSALSTTSRPSVHQLRGFPSPRFVPSSGVHSLSTVCSALSLGGLFHPPAALRTSPVQGFRRSAQPPSLIGRSCPLAVVARFAHRRIGCHDPRVSTSRLFSTQSRESRDRRLSLTNDRSPHRFLRSSRSLPGRCPRFPRSRRS